MDDVEVFNFLKTAHTQRQIPLSMFTVSLKTKSTVMPSRALVLVDLICLSPALLTPCPDGTVQKQLHTMVICHISTDRVGQIVGISVCFHVPH